MFQKPITITVFLFISIVCLACADTTQTTMAVLGIKTIGIDNAVATLISERIESRLVQCNTYHVISRSDMTLILKESVFQQSGACTEEERAIKAATLLGAQTIVTGSISRLGNTYSIVLKSIVVENGTINTSSNRTFTGSIEMLFSMVDGMVNEMFAAKPQSAPLTAVLPPKKSEPVLIVNSEKRQPSITKEEGCHAKHKTVSEKFCNPDSSHTKNKPADKSNSMLLGYGALCLLGAIGAVVIINQTVSH